MTYSLYINVQCIYGYFSHFLQFQVIWVIFINFELNGNAMCHFHSQHPIYHHIDLAPCTIYHFSLVEVYLLWKCCWVLQLLCNCCDIELTKIWAINVSNAYTSKTAVQVILWVNLLVQYQSPEPREALWHFFSTKQCIQKSNVP